MIKKLLGLLVCLGGLFASFAASAEGGCPPRQYPQQGQGWQTCVPIPGYSDGQSQTQSAPKEQWVSKWQAVVTDASKGALGTSIGAASRDEAVQLATSDCRGKGGIECELQITSANGCIAMAVGKSKLDLEGGTTKAIAEHSAVQACSKKDTNCTIYYSACSLAERIR